MKKELCGEMKGLYEKVFVAHDNFRAQLPIVLSSGRKNETVNSARKDFFIQGRKIAQSLIEFPDFTPERKDRRITKKIKEIIESDKQFHKTFYHDETIDFSVWDIKFEVKNGVVRFFELDHKRTLVVSDDFPVSRGKIVGRILADSNTPVEILDLQSSQLTDFSIDWLLYAVRHENNKLKALRLTNNQLENFGLRDVLIAMRSENCKITNLQIDNCGVADFAMDSLAELLNSENNRLIDLNLSGNKEITMDGWEAFFDALQSPNCKLQKLNLSNLGSFSLSETPLLRNALRNPTCRIKKLILRDTKLEDLGEFIRGLEKMESLEILDLSNSGVSDSLADAFEIYNVGINLKKLILSKNKWLTKSGQQALFRAIKKNNPQVEVVF